MNIKRFVVALLLVFAFSGVAYPWGASSGDGSRSRAIRETAVFFNNSGGSLVCGSIVIIDTRSSATGSGASLQQAVVAGTTMGSYITTTGTADVSGVVGVVLHGTTGSETCGNQEACVVVTKGPAQVIVLDSSDPVDTGDLIGTSGTAGKGGKFTGIEVNKGGYLGVALEDGSGGDNSAIWTWINPS